MVLVAWKSDVIIGIKLEEIFDKFSNNFVDTEVSIKHDKNPDEDIYDKIVKKRTLGLKVIFKLILFNWIN